MAACIGASAAYRKGFVRLILMQPSAPKPIFSLGRSLHHISGRRLSSSSRPGPKITKWLGRRVLALLAVAGFAGGALVIVSIIIFSSKYVSNKHP